MARPSAYHRILINPFPPQETSVNLKSLTARVQAILKAAPTYFVALAAVLTFAASTVDGWGGTWPTAAAWAIRLAAWLGSATAIIRRVTPVPADQRGILPKAPAT
jgi:hypothetical protein